MKRVKEKLNPEWKRLLRQAWSIRWIALAGVLSGIEVTMSYLGGIAGVPPGTFALMAGGVSMFALVARVMI